MFVPCSRAGLLVTVGNATSGEVVWGEFNLHLVARKNADVVHAHLSGDVGEHFVPVLELDPKHRVRERFDNRALDEDCVVLGLSQCSHHLCVLQTQFHSDTICVQMGRQ
jgi:hypothetical protein